MDISLNIAADPPPSKTINENNATKNLSKNVKKINNSEKNVTNKNFNKTKVTKPAEAFRKYRLFSKTSKDVISKADDCNMVPSTEQMFSNIGKSFNDLSIHKHTVINLERMSLKTLTVIQEKAIPVILNKQNVFIRSQTGSGKTLAYALPIVENLQNITPHISRRDGVQTIIVVPTRELALQTYELFMKLVEPFRWIVPGKLTGGEKRSSEKARLRKGINILIGTPGRLLDHILHTQNLKLDKVTCLVLDEADRLLDMGFQKDVNKLVEEIDKAENYDPMKMLKKQNTSEKPQRQTILLSATLNSNVNDLAKFVMKDFVYIDPLNSNDMLQPENSVIKENPKIAIPDTVVQKYLLTETKTRLVVLVSYIISKLNKNCKMFIFMASRQMVEFYEMLLKKCFITSKDIKKESDDDTYVLDVEILKLHGSMEQNERVTIFNKFKNSKAGILLCTDVAARGVDIPHADYVVQFNGPLEDDDYIHRVGRTGRAGKKGEAVIFVTESELDYIQHLREKKLKLVKETQDNVIKHLFNYLQHTYVRSPQQAGEMLQNRFEEIVSNHKELEKLGCLAYTSWSRYYSGIPKIMKQYFDVKKAHLGHYVTSFALKYTPQQVGRLVSQGYVKAPEKRLNKKLSNHENEEGENAQHWKDKAAKRSQNKEISEFDSGLEPVKKKKKNK